MKGPSPLLGYNNNVRHKGRVFHIQTEDSGIRHPHVITHLFMDGGRIVKTLKTSYAQHLEDENGHEHVRALMKQQHQGMFRDLRDGKFDYALAPAGAPPSSGAAGPASSAPVSAPPASLVPRTISSSDLAAVSSPTEPTFPAQEAEVVPPTVASRSEPALAAVPLAPIPVPTHRLTDPSAQTMPDMRAVHSEAPPATFVPSAPAPAPSDRAVASAAAVPHGAPPASSEEREPSAGDPAAYDAIEEYEPSSSATHRRTPGSASDMPPPPRAMLSKARPDGVYRSQATPTPPPPARAALGSSPGARAGAAPRPPVGTPVSPSTRPQSRRSLFGEDYVSEKSLDEVILSYLAEDLDTDK